MSSIIAVIVVYHPQPQALQVLLTALMPQVAQVLVVDNGGSDAARAACLPQGQGQVAWLAQPFNIGLASALNLGIRHALERDASHVILFDQDSVPAPGMVALLLAAEQKLRAQGRSVAAVGPVFFDAASGQIAPILAPQRWFTRRKYQADFDGMIEAAYLITSGQLIAAPALAAIGLMRDDLFIDGIDIEWALRARHRGWHSFAVCNAHLQHQLGDVRRQIGTRQVSLHSPLRHYYIIRNSFVLMRSPEINWRWKCSDFLKTLRRLIVFPLLSSAPLDHISMMARGIWHGLIGKTGALHNEK
jgi:rhamnosyltransferase